MMAMQSLACFVHSGRHVFMQCRLGQRKQATSPCFASSPDNFVNFWYRFSGGLALKYGGDSVRCQRSKAQKFLKEFGGNSDSDFGARFGVKFWMEILKLRGTFVLQLFLREDKPGVSKPGGFPLLGEMSGLCRRPFRDCTL